ncbi:unnamed protein product [Sphenostylis stenocarpa]|uniref:Uncharacterized protein n=1 Tax=Sphenostylis stenocarpa TaxID=92480 RepID=A0AA86SF09_9FABA|nr:unnamed protein product [Sphenostylis stenocarpa]
MPRLGTAVIHSFIVGCCSLSRKKEKDPEKKEVGFGSIWDRTILFSLAVSSQFSDPRGTLVKASLFRTRVSSTQGEIECPRKISMGRSEILLDSILEPLTKSMVRLVQIRGAAKKNLVALGLVMRTWSCQTDELAMEDAACQEDRLWCSIAYKANLELVFASKDQDEIRFLGRTNKQGLLARMCKGRRCVRLLQKSLALCLDTVQRYGSMIRDRLQAS